LNVELLNGERFSSRRQAKTAKNPARAAFYIECAAVGQLHSIGQVA